MRLSNGFFKTYREAPADAELTSHKLLVRGGYIYKQSAGLYAFLPLGVRVMNKLENIIRQEMDSVGLLEVSMPKLLPEEVYATRIDHFGSSMFRLKDRNGKPMCLGPTHEEVFTFVVKDMVSSYKQLPVGLYQIGSKFRDEVRPRFGLQRAKEFIMKDAYTFHTNQQSLDEWYDAIKGAYENVFNRLGLDFVPVLADNGAMGGSGSQEFMVKSTVGEDEIICCPKCKFAGNVEKAEAISPDKKSEQPHNLMKMIDTPKVKTISELVSFLGREEKEFLKAVVYSYEKGTVVALVRGDREVEEVKLINHLGAIELNMASASDIEKIGSVAGFVGATKDINNVYVVADNEVRNMVNFVMGANQMDKHYVDTNVEDLRVDVFIDLRKAVAGDLCPVCGHPLEVVRGIEVGHIFKLGKRYTEALDCTYLDENGKKQVMEMGCYGIGVSRTMSACVEQFADDKGINWPTEIAPYKVGIIIANQKDETLVEAGEKLYKSLNTAHTEVLLDDRKESLGVKFKDLELIGIPTIIVAGRDVNNGQYEVINRKTDERKLMSYDEIMSTFVK